jgi:hypothetical protein
VADDVVRELGEGARGRDMVPVNHGGSPNFHWWFRPSRTVPAVAGAVFVLTVQHAECAYGRIE